MPNRYETNTEYTATCSIDHHVYNPHTNEMTWQPYESVTITEPTLERLTERAFLYIGRPERIPQVQAIRLTGVATIMHQERDMCYEHTNSASVELHVLRERSRTMPVNHHNIVPLHVSAKQKVNASAALYL